MDNNWRTRGWGGRIYPYVKSTGVYKCPDDPTGPGTGTLANYLPISYALNGNISATTAGNGTGGALSNLASPARTVLLYESIGGIANVTSPTDGADLTLPASSGSVLFNGDYNDYYANNAGLQEGAPALGQGTGGGSIGGVPNPNVTFSHLTYHTGGTNWLLADGHVKWLRPVSVAPGNDAENANNTKSANGLVCERLGRTHSSGDFLRLLRRQTAGRRAKYAVPSLAHLFQAFQRGKLMNNDTTGSPSYLYLLAGVGALGGLLFGYDTAVISGAGGFLQQHFHLSAGLTGWAVSSVLVGCMAGALSGGPLSDRVGRKPMLLGCASCSPCPAF